MLFRSRLCPDAQVVGKACPLFVSLVEEGWLKDEITTLVARRYLEELKKSDIDTLILGCTHYPLLRSTVAGIMGEGVTLVNPAYETAVSLRTLLRENNLANDGHHKNGENLYEFFVSDAAERFKRIAKSILPFDIMGIRQIQIEDY